MMLNFKFMITTVLYCRRLCLAQIKIYRLLADGQKYGDHKLQPRAYGQESNIPV